MCFEHFCVKRLPDRQRQTSFLQQLLRKNRPSHHPEILTAAAGLIYCSNQLHKTTFSFYICKLLQAISQNSCDNIFYIQKLFIVYNFFGWIALFASQSFDKGISGNTSYLYALYYWVGVGCGLVSVANSKVMIYSHWSVDDSSSWKINPNF